MSTMQKRYGERLWRQASRRLTISSSVRMRSLPGFSFSFLRLMQGFSLIQRHCRVAQLREEERLEMYLFAVGALRVFPFADGVSRKSCLSCPMRAGVRWMRA